MYKRQPEYTKILTSSSVEAVTLANNHSEDYYEAGLQDTKKYLDEASIGPVSYTHLDVYKRQEQVK